MQFYCKFLFDLLKSDINCEINVIANSVMWKFCCVNIVEQNQTKSVTKKSNKTFFILGPSLHTVILVYVA